MRKRHIDSGIQFAIVVEKVMNGKDPETLTIEEWNLLSFYSNQIVVNLNNDREWDATVNDRALYWGNFAGQSINLFDAILRINMYSAGYTMTEIARRQQVSPSAIRGWFYYNFIMG